ncbi:MAG: DNA polymerase I [Fimbriimonadaceae bacterium]|nr:MAG: DNA polymerase I [Fimbriimonadaceae bacterium]
MPDKRMVIIDGYSLLFRAFYGTRFLSTSDGRPTNALFGFVSMLFQLLENIKPDSMVVALDAPGKTFRHAEYAEYKGTRRDTPQELISQLDFSRDFINALHIPVLEMTGYEADDIVGTLSRLGEENGYDTYIVTGDLDSLQLVDKCVHVMTTLRGVTDVKIYDEDAVMERYGFGPDRVTDYKALVGDTSDNIPGVPGIGDKTATLLIKEFGTIEQILERIEEVPEKFRKKIVGNEDQMVKSKWLATIIRDVPIEYGFEPYRLSAEQIEDARNMLTSLEFRNPAKKFETIIAPYRADGAQSAPVEVQSVSIEVDYEDRLLDHTELTKWLGDDRFAVMTAQIAAQGSLLDDNEQMAFIAKGSQVRRTTPEAARAAFLSDPGRAIGHDTKMFYRGQSEVDVQPGFDATLAAYVLQTGRSNYALAELAQGYLELDHQPVKPEDQVACLFALEGVMRDRLEREKQTNVLDKIELPLVPILARMEDFGIELNSGTLREFSRDLETEMIASQSQAWQLAGEEFNLLSPKQVGEVLFEKMQIPGGKKTKTGYSTGADILQELEVEHEIASVILHYRELAKLKGTYSDALPKSIGSDGRIHTSFNQAVAVTGRLSSNEPNLQNIPNRTPLGRKIRQAFVAADGFTLGSYDYSQIELRILAHMCRDEALVQAFNDRVDVHTVTAALMYDIDQSAVTKEQRGYAKLLNYAVLYGVTGYGLAAQLGRGFSVEAANGLIKQYNERFPKVKAFTESMVEEARSKGFTVTACGRRRNFPDIHAGNRNTRSYAERQAMNAPIQGTAADMIKLAMIDVHKTMKSSDSRMLLQVHDELVFECADDFKQLKETIRSKMENALPLSVPIEVDFKFGKNWLEMTPDGL